jgi:tRNA splicing endonuclease
VQSEDLDYKVFDHLTDLGYFVCEEQNFGARFAVYSKDPDSEEHAEFLVFTGGNDRLYLVNRLATILKKEVSRDLKQGFVGLFGRGKEG